MCVFRMVCVSSYLIDPCGGVYMLLAWCMFCSVLIYLLVVYVYIAIAQWVYV